MSTTDGALAEATGIAQALVGDAVKVSHLVTGGRNSRIWRITSGGRAFALKQYPSRRDDPRDRLSTEVGALRLMERHGIDTVPRVLGVGYDTISDILNNNLALKILLLVAVCKALAMVISLGSGTSGGLLAPMFMSSAALGKLITLHKKLTGVKGKLALCGISPQIFEVFAITKLDKIFKIHKDYQTALTSF